MSAFDHLVARLRDEQALTKSLNNAEGLPPELASVIERGKDAPVLDPRSTLTIGVAPGVVACHNARLNAIANGQLLAVTNQIDTLRSQYARMIGQVALDARMAHVQALLDTAMQQAAELGLELANNHQFSAAIRVDNRLAILGRNNGMLSSLRNYQGSSR